MKKNETKMAGIAIPFPNEQNRDGLNLPPSTVSLNCSQPTVTILKAPQIPKFKLFIALFLRTLVQIDLSSPVKLIHVDNQFPLWLVCAFHRIKPEGLLGQITGTFNQFTSEP